MREHVEEAGGGGDDFEGELDGRVVAVGWGGCGDGYGDGGGGGGAGAEGLAPPDRAAGGGGEFLGPDELHAAGGGGEGGDLAGRDRVVDFCEERFGEGMFGGVEGFLLRSRRLVCFRRGLAGAFGGRDAFVVFGYGE